MVLIREEFESHYCNPFAQGTRHVEIPVSQWWVSKDERGEERLTALGLDGCAYRLVKVTLKGFEELPTKEGQPDRTTEEATLYRYVHCPPWLVSLSGVTFWVERNPRQS